MSNEMGTTTTVPTGSEPRLSGTEQVKHTPGPWKVYDGIKRDTHWHRHASVWSLSAEHLVAYTDFMTPEIAVANARLIAAAPAMYQYIESSASAGCATAKSIMEQINGSR